MELWDAWKNDNPDDEENCSGDDCRSNKYGYHSSEKVITLRGVRVWILVVVVVWWCCVWVRGDRRWWLSGGGAIGVRRSSGGVAIGVRRSSGGGGGVAGNRSIWVDHGGGYGASGVVGELSGK